MIDVRMQIILMSGRIKTGRIMLSEKRLTWISGDRFIVSAISL